MKLNLSAIFAMRGRCSQIWMPETLVPMAENGPRTSEGALVLMSYMS